MGYFLEELVLVLACGILLAVFWRRKEVALSADLPIPADRISIPGTLLGNSGPEPYFLSDEETNAHVLVLGATGAGKTTTILHFVESAASRGLACIIADGKGDPGLQRAVARIAGRHQRPYECFDMARPQESCSYNPVRRGTALEIRDRLIESSDWSEPHYKFASARYLQEAINIIRKTGGGRDLPRLVAGLEPHALALAARALPREERLKVNDMIDHFGRDALGLINRLSVYTEGECGLLLKEGEKEIDLEQVVQNGAITLFSLDSLRYPQQARLVGRLLVLDLKALVARMFSRGQKVFTVFDEFGVFACPQVADLLNKGRGAGVHLVLAVQELADLRAGGGNNLADQVLGNTNVKIIHRQDVPASADILASVIGARDSLRFNFNTGRSGQTTSTVWPARTPLVESDHIKRLSCGEAIVVVKHPAFTVRKVAILPQEGDPA